MKMTARIAVLGVGVVIAGIIGNAVMLRRASQDPGGSQEPSTCLAEATINISANPATVTLGQASVVSWSVGLPNGCTGVRVRFHGESVGHSGSRSVAPARTSMYSVVVSQTRLGVYGEKTKSTQVAVTYPDRVVIGPSTPDPVAVLVGALTSPNERQVVELCDVDLDLTGLKNIDIGSNRSLIASPGCARGPRKYGPRIFVSDERGRAALFVVTGDNVLISGFRLEGPTNGVGAGGRKEKGILIAPEASAAPIHNIEISNMEIYHWSGLAIQVVDNVAMAERGRLFNTNMGAVRIKGNFLHRNRHSAGEGYGVDVAGGAYATIEQNVFDNNRHAIAGGSKNSDGDGKDYSGYLARDNLILVEGGLHCSDSWWGALTGWLIHCTHTHQVDMHGDDNRFYSGSNWKCGTAGETILIERNTILYTQAEAIFIRGNPADKAVVDGNVFRHGSADDAIIQNGYCGWGDNITNPIDVRPNNVFDADPTTELGHCDFVGDNIEDEFMATGVTWWARSAVTHEWRYLNTMPEKLPSLTLQNVNADEHCDVAKRTNHPEAGALIVYSSQGTGPWTSVGQLEQ